MHKAYDPPPPILPNRFLQADRDILSIANHPYIYIETNNFALADPCKIINWLMSFINRLMPRWRALAPPERSKWLLGLDTTQGYAQNCISILWHIMVPVESHETHCDANHRSKQIDLSKKSQDLKTNFYGTVASPTCILCVLNKQTCDQCRNRQSEKWNPRHGPMSSAINTPNWICRMGMGWLGCPKTHDSKGARNKSKRAAAQTTASQNGNACNKTKSQPGTTHVFNGFCSTSMAKRRPHLRGSVANLELQMLNAYANHALTRVGRI